MLKEKPDINQNSKKLVETSKTASSYANLKVEDRLRLYGMQLKDSKAAKTDPPTKAKNHLLRSVNREDPLDRNPTPQQLVESQISLEWSFATSLLHN